MTRWHFGVAALAVALGSGIAAQHGSDSRDMALLATTICRRGRAYQPTIHKQGDRYIAYIGHHGGRMMNPLTKQMEPNGTSIVDVTNPRSPRYLAHIPGEAGEGEGGGAQMTRVCNGSTLPRADRSKVYLLRSFGISGHEMWDVTTPEKPVKITTIVERAAQHPQERVGVRHRHRLPRLGRPGVAHAPHDEDLRPGQSRRAGVHPRLTASSDSSRVDRPGADRAARSDLPRSEGESRLLRARHGARGHRSDRRSRQAAERAEGADRSQPAVSADLARRPAARRGRAHRAAAARHDARRVREAEAAGQRAEADRARPWRPDSAARVAGAPRLPRGRQRDDRTRNASSRGRSSG